MTQLEKPKSEAAILSTQEKAELAFFLLQSLDKQAEADVEPTWDAELARRAAEIASGKVVGKPAAEVFARLQEKYS
jgi:putative addiction module component (TIGR02574 family)